MPFAIWVTGLPGSGKSTIAESLLKILHKNNIHATYLNMDLLRKKLVKRPMYTSYTSKERDIAYKKFADIGILENMKNKNVIYDATAHKLKYRNYAKKRIKNFVEVYIKCPLKTCIGRETKRRHKIIMTELYKKALQRRKKEKRFNGIGKVIGIDVKYQENKRAELIIRSNKINPPQAAKIIFNFLKARGYV